MPRLILASTSPYRREILARLGVPFEAVAPVCDETPLAGESAADTANRLAVLKAQSLVSRFPDALVIGSDQVALLDGQQLGKPHTVENAHAMLAAMRVRFLGKVAADLGIGIGAQGDGGGIDPNALIGLPLFALITLLAQEGVEIL